jgi:uncharacterized protein (UPF0261 family)
MTSAREVILEPIGAIVVLGTFDSKGEEHLFLKTAIEARGHRVITINVGTKGPSPWPPDVDLAPHDETLSRDQAIARTLDRGQRYVVKLYERGWLGGVISAGGGTGTHLCAGIMRALPMGVPKVMVSTVASRDMAPVVGTRDVTMIHSVGDMLGVNRITGPILDQAAAAVCAMAASDWRPDAGRKCIGLSMFGFITKAAEEVRRQLEAKGYEVVAFHANGTGGLAMEELAREGRFDGILDLAPHELADTLLDGYCRLIGPGRFEPDDGRQVPRLVVPGGLDCAVLEFTRDTVPGRYKDRKIFYYDFRSAVRLSLDESLHLADQLADRLNRFLAPTKVLIPTGGWSEADGPGAPLFDPDLSREFVAYLKKRLDPQIEVLEQNYHINDPFFARVAATVMDEMLGALPLK